MEPVIRNFRNVYTPEGPSARMIWLDDHPTTCTMTYSEIYPNKTSSHHIHDWEHEVYIIKGSGTLVCDGKEYPVKPGDAMFIPPRVDHYTLNNGGEGVIRRIEINPLIAALSGGARNQGGKGTGRPPVIRNFRNLNRETGSRILNRKDGVPNYLMLYNGAMQPGAMSHPETGGHTHAWDHAVFILEGHGTLVCDGKEYLVAEGDAVLVPPNTRHQWKNDSDLPVVRVTFNALASEAHE
ncbi:MAG TPA: cupin domain-containing protein [Dehalococcoidia bacterium]|nr:cupin domain-containing protein [Dehalococcoidia bacterium]